MGSARESRDWYYKALPVLGQDVIGERLLLMSEIIRLLLVMVPHQRGRDLREASNAYHIAAESPD